MTSRRRSSIFLRKPLHRIADGVSPKISEERFGFAERFRSPVILSLRERRFSRSEVLIPIPTKMVRDYGSNFRPLIQLNESKV